MQFDHAITWNYQFIWLRTIWSQREEITFHKTRNKFHLRQNEKLVSGFISTFIPSLRPPPPPLSASPFPETVYPTTPFNASSQQSFASYSFSTGTIHTFYLNFYNIVSRNIMLWCAFSDLSCVCVFVCVHVEIWILSHCYYNITRHSD